MPSSSPQPVLLRTVLAWMAGLYLVPFLATAVYDGIQWIFNLHELFYMLSYLMYLFLLPTASGAAAGAWMSAAWRAAAVELAGFAWLPRLPRRVLAAAGAAALLLMALLRPIIGSRILPPREPIPLDATGPVDYFNPLAGLPYQALTALLCGLAAGAVFGLLLAWVLRLRGPSVALLALAWGAGFAIGAGIGRPVYLLSSLLSGPHNVLGWLLSISTMWLEPAIMGLVAGALGGWVTLRVSRPAQAHPAEPVPGSLA